MDRRKMAWTALAVWGVLALYAAATAPAAAEVPPVEGPVLNGLCRGEVQLLSLTGESAVFRYVWHWEHPPVVNLTDAVEIEYQPLSPEGRAIVGSEWTAMRYGVTYYLGDEPVETVEALRTPGAEPPGQGWGSFAMLRARPGAGGRPEVLRAGSGYVECEVKLPEGVNNRFGGMLVAGSYRHATPWLPPLACGTVQTTARAGELFWEEGTP